MSTPTVMIYLCLRKNIDIDWFLLKNSQKFEAVSLSMKSTCSTWYLCLIFI